MQHIDIIVFAIIAVVVGLRLRAALGQRHDDEPRRPNPYALPKAGKEEDDEGFIVGPKPDNAPGKPETALSPQILAPDSLSGGIAMIRQLDPSFDEKEFLQGARAAFKMIVETFAAGDTEKLRRYLGPDVHEAFARAIAVRQAANQRLETKIVAVKDAELLRARLTGDVARLTVRFTSEQTNATYDENNQLVEGNPGQREEIEDVWSFARNLRQDDPSWLLVETRV